MFISRPLPFIAAYIDDLNQAIKQYDSNLKLTRIQKSWLAFCIMAIFMTRTLCWAKFGRAYLGKKSPAALSWMFRHATIPWQILLAASTIVFIKRYGITRWLCHRRDRQEKIEGGKADLQASQDQGQVQWRLCKRAEARLSVLDHRQDAINSLVLKTFSRRMQAMVRHPNIGLLSHLEDHQY